MELKQKYMIRNDCYRANRKIKPVGIMIHSTATPGVMAEEWFDRWNKSFAAGEINRQVCVHAFVDDKEAWQYLPWDHRGWHAGSGSKGTANDTHIGIEICEPPGFGYNGSKPVGYDKAAHEEYFRNAYANAIALSVLLCEEFGWTESDILDHSEGNRRGIASGHADVMHWFPIHGKSVNTFRADVKKALEGPVVVPEEKPLDGEWYTVVRGDTLSGIAKKYKDVTWQEIALENGLKQANLISIGQKLRIPVHLKSMQTTENLNLRTGAGTQHSRILTIPKGNSVVVHETVNGWSRVTYVKDQGWVSSKYLTEVVVQVAKVYMTTENLNLRKGAGTNHGIIVTIPKGTHVSVYANDKGWSNVKYLTNVGWCSDKFLLPVLGAKTTIANLNLRTAAGTSNKILLTIPKGNYVTVHSVEEGWAKVTYKGVLGWVSNAYLKG